MTVNLIYSDYTADNVCCEQDQLNYQAVFSLSSFHVSSSVDCLFKLEKQLRNNNKYNFCFGSRPNASHYLQSMLDLYGMLGGVCVCVCACVCACACMCVCERVHLYGASQCIGLFV